MCSNYICCSCLATNVRWPTLRFKTTKKTFDYRFQSGNRVEIIETNIVWKTVGFRTFFRERLVGQLFLRTIYFISFNCPLYNKCYRHSVVSIFTHPFVTFLENNGICKSMSFKTIAFWGLVALVVTAFNDV